MRHEAQSDAEYAAEQTRRAQAAARPVHKSHPTPPAARRAPHLHNARKETNAPDKPKPPTRPAHSGGRDLPLACELSPTPASPRIALHSALPASGDWNGYGWSTARGEYLSHPHALSPPIPCAGVRTRRAGTPVFAEGQSSMDQRNLNLAAKMAHRIPQIAPSSCTFGCEERGLVGMGKHGGVGDWDDAAAVDSKGVVCSLRALERHQASVRHPERNLEGMREGPVRDGSGIRIKIRAARELAGEGRAALCRINIVLRLFVRVVVDVAAVDVDESRHRRSRGRRVQGPGPELRRTRGERVRVPRVPMSEGFLVAAAGEVWWRDILVRARTGRRALVGGRGAPPGDLPTQGL
ncbi:hypothetical protein C8J57DRAFT_1238544 [Mycena rebaudengoi]|nr:hypothetical protein C8J57DRAFT_1238544 [Mycena rebaudengoi]